MYRNVQKSHASSLDPFLHSNIHEPDLYKRHAVCLLKRNSRRNSYEIITEGIKELTNSNQQAGSKETFEGVMVETGYE